MDSRWSLPQDLACDGEEVVYGYGGEAFEGELAVVSEADLAAHVFMQSDIFFASRPPAPR